MADMEEASWKNHERNIMEETSLKVESPLSPFF
jgi:hypothetical protein